jgi:hypothetical protein
MISLWTAKPMIAENSAKLRVIILELLLSTQLPFSVKNNKPLKQQTLAEAPGFHRKKLV